MVACCCTAAGTPALPLLLLLRGCGAVGSLHESHVVLYCIAMLHDVPLVWLFDTHSQAHFGGVKSLRELLAYLQHPDERTANVARSSGGVQGRVQHRLQRRWEVAVAACKLVADHEPVKCASLCQQLPPALAAGRVHQRHAHQLEVQQAHVF
eukprot:GHRQ01018549.1.p1 GENE.GHRQ01018549.1~~GHRQ01018549.1.p1  ORF type:complete len:152 (-),score=22.72 GHRQ01018549.1:742-1197(-)